MLTNFRQIIRLCINNNWREGKNTNIIMFIQFQLLTKERFSVVWFRNSVSYREEISPPSPRKYRTKLMLFRIKTGWFLGGNWKNVSLIRSHRRGFVNTFTHRKKFELWIRDVARFRILKREKWDTVKWFHFSQSSTIPIKIHERWAGNVKFQYTYSVNGATSKQMI